MAERSDWGLLGVPTAATIALMLLYASWDLVAPLVGLALARSPTDDKILLTLLVLAAASLAARISYVVARRRIDAASDAYTMRKVVNLAVVLIAAGIILVIWLELAESMALSLGLVGAGLMLALAPVITSVAGWIHIAVTKPYGAGDRVQVGGVRGDVVDVRLMHTMLLEVDDEGPTGSVVQVPNRAVLDGKVVNDTKDFTFRWITVQLPVSYDCDWRKARDLFRSILLDKTGGASVEAKETIRQLRGKYYMTKRDVAPGVSISFDSNWIMLKGRFVAPIEDAIRLRDEVHEAVITVLEEHPDVEIGSESMTVTVRDGGS